MSGVTRDGVVGVVMAGGDGERLWPVSTKGQPKQFQDVLGLGETMLQGAVRRLEKVCLAERLVVVTSDRHVGLVATQAPRVRSENILGEPQKRSTAPCVALATALALRVSPGAVMVVAPSDHFIADDHAFSEDLTKAISFAAEHDSLVTIGIPPLRAATEYGYVERGEAVGNGFYRAVRFREKPSGATAEEYLARGGFLWNSGMFVWKVSAIAQALRTHMPGLLEMMEALPFGASSGELDRALRDVYARVEPQSIDYGVMERAENVVVMPATFKWSDVGTWPALLGLLPRDERGNALRGAAKMTDCRGVVAWIDDGCEAQIEGLGDGSVVALRGGRLLVRGKRKM